jgi:carbon storage regulator
MLVLSRRLGEEIVIGEGIRVTVLGIKGNQVRLGIVAPPDVPVNRLEVVQRLQRQANAGFPPAPEPITVPIEPA